MSCQSRETNLATAILGLATCLALAGISSGTPDEAAVSAARSNAKQALKLAIAKLQETAGPDQRVTAMADILDSHIARPHLTGVWNSWEIQATAPPAATDYESDAKDAKFVGWLVSNPDAAATTQVSFANQGAISPVTLMGTGTLGNSAPASSFVTASKIPVASPAGAYAWAVLDEGVKARINTPFSNSAASTGAKTQQLGSGERPGTEFIPGLDGLGRNSFEAASPDFADFTKGIGNTNFVPTAERISPASAAALKSLAHDVTLHSLGLFTDTARGGLKQDFSLLANSVVPPSAYNGRGVYNSRLGMSANSAPSDPRWESLQQFARIYKDTTRLVSSGGVPVLKARGPTGWNAATGSDPANGIPGVTQLAPPSGPVLMPTVAKVQMIFSLATRDIYTYPKVSDTTPKPLGSSDSGYLHYPYAPNFAGTAFDYLLHLIYTPVVTIHNPYNVALEFTELRVVFGNVPFALQVFRNGVAQTNGLAPLDTMYYQAETGNLSKRFGMTLKTKTTSGTPGTTALRLLPGEVMLFSPYLDPNRTWAQEHLGTRIFSDWDSGNGTATRTLTIDGIPGWRGDSVGFDLDWFCPNYNGLRVSSTEVENGRSMTRHGSIPARAIDEFSVKFAPLSVPALSNNKFKVEIFAKPTGSASVISSGVIEMDYETPTALQDSLLGPGGTITYPATGTINTMAMHSHSTTQLKYIATTKPFAVVSMQAKTTFGGQDPAGEDGKLATKPWSFAHAPIGASTQKAVTGHPANHSHEFSIQRLDIGTYNLLQFDPQSGRGNFITGHTGNTGQKFGALYDIPLTPIQTFASLNGANPGGSSGYLPRFAQPIGNSWAHPLIDSSRIIESGAEGYSYADHSFLLNLALYDGFYFSGLADQTGPFGNGTTSSTLATRFAAGTPLDDPRLILYRPDGQAASAFPGEVATSTAYSNIAAWQLMAGAFNINSTSISAWRAMLASIHDSQALFNSIDKAAGSSTFSPLLAATAGKSRISRFRLPASASEADGGQYRDAYWLGPREYSDQELHILAESIVEQVRLRGPFLSMAEFVNRRLGPASDAMAQRGALQQAIDNSNLNQPLAASTSAGFEIPVASVSGYKYKNPTAGSGPSYQGAPGYLTQADILNVLGNAATARSDTFIVRSYGESHGSSGETTATAVCEAVIQRLPDWVDPADQAATAPANLTSQTNQTLGRSFRLISFRWLNDDEI